MSLDSKRSVLTLTTATVIKEDLFVLEMCTLFVLTLIDLAMQCYWSFLCFLAAASAAARAAATEAGKSAAETVKPKTFSGMNIEVFYLLPTIRCVLGVYYCLLFLDVIKACSCVYSIPCSCIADSYYTVDQSIK